MEVILQMKWFINLNLILHETNAINCICINGMNIQTTEEITNDYSITCVFALSLKMTKLLVIYHSEHMWAIKQQNQISGNNE